MSLNSLSLPPSLLVSFYQKSLVQGVASPVPFLGKNAKNILVVVDKTGAAFLPDGELQFLTNVLSACGLGLADVAIVNWQNRSGNSAGEIVSQTAAKKIILFNVDASAFGFPANAPLYAVQTVDTKQMVTAASLSEIENDKAAKKQLWTALQQLFAL